MFCEFNYLSRMLIAFDIGNSDITMGLWNGTDWQVWRIPSRTDQPELFYGIKIRDSLLEANVSIDNIDIIVISSVVPGLTDKIKNVVRSLFKENPSFLDLLFMISFRLRY